jgi:putative acetyltransferase
MTPRYRRYSVADGLGCFDVFYRAVHIGAASHYTAQQRQAWAPSDTMQASWPAHLKQAATWVAITENAPVGFVSLEVDGHLDMAYVAPEHQRIGVAQALHGRMLKDAAELELPRLFTEASHLARPFFEKCGWHVTQPQTVMRNGVEIDRFQMAIDL